MFQIATAIHAGLVRLSGEEDEIITRVLMETIGNILHKRWGHPKKWGAVEALGDDLSERLLTPSDFQVLALTCERIMVPITQALHAIPSDARVF